MSFLFAKAHVSETIVYLYAYDIENKLGRLMCINCQKIWIIYGFGAGILCVIFFGFKKVKR